MSERPALSKAEMEVARVLWEIGEATVRQVHDGMPVRSRDRFHHRADLPAAAGTKGLRAQNSTGAFASTRRR